MNKKLIERIRELFNQRLQSKTGWGKNEISILLNEVITQACLEVIDG
jgi:hypothetical protein